jgi:hypothetical protein
MASQKESKIQSWRQRTSTSYRSEISEAKFGQFARLFSVDLNAKQMAQATGLNRNTANRLLMGVRERVTASCGAESPVLGVAEVDEGYFGARRVKGTGERHPLGRPAGLRRAGGHRPRQALQGQARRGRARRARHVRFPVRPPPSRPQGKQGRPGRLRMARWD